MSVFSVAGSTPSDTGFEIKSARFDAGSSTKLTRTPAVAGNRRTWTISCWFKWSIQTQTYTQFFDGGGAGSAECTFYLYGADSTLQWSYWTGSSEAYKLKTTQVFRDPSAWYHFVAVQDTTQSTASNRLKIYLNGEQITSFSTANYPAQDLECSVNDTYQHSIGSWESGSGRYYSGYLAEFYLIDGQALTPAFFAETNELTNQWQPTNPATIKEAVTFGTNGFYLPFSNDALATSFIDGAKDKDVVVYANTHTDTGTKKVGSAAADFDGTGDYLAVGDAGFKLGNTSASWTIEFWIYLDAIPTHHIAIDHRANTQNNGGFSFFTNIGSGGLGFDSSNGTTWAGNLQDPVANTVDTWYHYAVVQEGGSIIKMYRNGTEVDSSTTLMSDDSGSYLPWFIGGGYNNGGSHSNNYYIYGYLDEIRVSNVARYTANFTDFGQGGGTISSPTNFTTDDNTLLLMHMDGSNDGVVFTDSSDSPRHSITAVGNVKNIRVSDHPAETTGEVHVIGPKVGSSAIDFDGDGDGLTVADSTDFDLSNQPFTWEAWVYPIERASPYLFPTILEQYQSGSERTYLRIERQSSMNRYEFEIDSGGTNFSVNSDSTPNYNAWQHVAVCRVGNVFTMYVDGVAQTPVTNSITINARAAPFRIGEWGGNSANGDWSGYMDEIRLSNVARYTANFTPPTAEFSSDANTMLLIHSNTTMGSTTFTDSGPNTHAITVLGNCKHVAPKMGTGMAVFDGTDYLQIPVSQDFNMGDVNFTIEMWIYMNSLGDYAFWSFSQGMNDTVLKFNNSGSNGIQFYHYPQSGSMWNMSQGSTAGWAADTWYHIALVRNGTAWNIYRDGTSVVSHTGSESLDYKTLALTIGATAYSSGVYEKFDGYIDEHRTSKGIARYTSNFTPPTTAFKDDKDTVLLLHMDGGGGIDPETNLPTLPGQGTYFWDASTNAIFYDSEGLATNKSIIDFDGNGDRLEVPTTADFDWGTSQNFTIEGWTYLDTYDANGVAEAATFAASPVLDVAGGWRAAVWSVSGIDVFTFVIYNGSGWPVHPNPAKTFPLGKWVHWAACRNGSNYTVFQDGIATGVDADAYDFDMGAAGLQLGHVQAWGSQRYLDGQQDQVRVSNTARYSPPSYTPAVAEFSNDANTKLLLHADGTNGGTTFTDSSGSPHTVTRANTVTSTAQKKFGTASAVFTSGNSDLQIADSNDWNLDGDFTWEWWIRPDYVAGSQPGAGHMAMVGQYVDGNNRIQTFLSDSGGWQFWIYQGGAIVSVADGITTFAADTWYSMAAVRENGNIGLFVNGVLTGTSYTNAVVNLASPLYIGQKGQSTDRQWFYGYIDEIRISNSARYTLTGFTPSTTPFIADTNTKLLIQSDFSEGGLGADHSNNYNYFTPTNLTASDMMEDSPKNNFATLNPLMPSTATYLSEGNLRNNPGGAAWSRGVSTFGATSGKWYFEIYVGAMGTNGAIGIRNDVGLWDQTGGPPGYCEYGPETGGQLYRDGLTTIPIVGTFAAGDIISIAVNMDDNEIQWFKNNAVLGGAGNVPLALPSSTQNGFVAYGAANTDDHRWNFGQDSSFAGVKTAQGNQDGNDKGDFYYAPPAGYLALCTDNLAAPSIALPTEYFEPAVYTGNGSTQTISSLDFQPDFVWIKNRTDNSTSFGLFNAVMGAGVSTKSNDNSSERPVPPGTPGATDDMYAFTSSGFSVGTNNYINVNTSAKNYVAWNWKAGGTPTVDNSAGAGNVPTAGSVKINGTNSSAALAGTVAVTRLSANTTAGFSIGTVTFPGSSTYTYAHGLSQAPELVIGKDVEANARWWVYAKPMGNTKWVGLNENSAASTVGTVWQDTTPSASVVYVGGDFTTGSQEYITYCFHSVEGYSKVGSYEGNGSGDGPFIYTGFSPAMIIIKNIDDAQDWSIWDNKRPGYNVINTYLKPNDSAATSTATSMDMVSNGFRCRGTSDINNNNKTMIYIAFAENPFKTSNAR